MFFSNAGDRGRQKGLSGGGLPLQRLGGAVSRGNDVSVYWSRHGRSASDGPHSGWLLTRHAPRITNRGTIARTARSDHASCACKGSRTKQGDIRANSNECGRRGGLDSDRGVTTGTRLARRFRNGGGYIKAGISDRVATRRAGPTG